MTRLKSAMSRTAFILLTACLMHSNFGWSAEASGDMADFSPTTTLSPEYINRFMTNNKIDGVGNQEKCAKQVLEFRQRFTNETRTLGVEPTVGLGAALLIFLMVGAFAAGIAQAFQLVITIFSIKNFNTTDVLMAKLKIFQEGKYYQFSLRSDVMFITMQIISIQHLMLEAKLASV